jgi:hypothetical protein
MDSATDLYVVFLREHRKNGDTHEVIEQPLGSCETYEDAKRMRERALRYAPDCVIRFLGTSGGGD